jgi:hypothetical protein
MTITINGTTGIAGVDGSAATPAVQGADTNTGVFYPVADTVAISTGGTERMRVTSTGVNLNGSTSGTLTIAAPAVAGTNTLTLVAATETLAPIVSATAQASTSGTSIDFTSIPSWVKRITVMFSGVSTSGTSIVQLQLGDAGGVETTGYAGITVRSGGSSNVYTSAYSSGFLTQTVMIAASTYAAQIVLTNISGNMWAMSGMTANTTSPSNDSCFMCGDKTLSATLDRVRITTVNGTDTFDAGTINIMYE